MNYININYNLNQKYIVHENAFQGSVQSALNEIKNIKLSSEPRISFDLKTGNVSVYVEIKIKNKTIIEPVLKLIVSRLNSEIKNLIDFKPQNIQVRFLGFY